MTVLKIMTIIVMIASVAITSYFIKRLREEAAKRLKEINNVYAGEYDAQKIIIEKLKSRNKQLTDNANTLKELDKTIDEYIVEASTKATGQVEPIYPKEGITIDTAYNEGANSVKQIYLQKLKTLKGIVKR